MKLRLITDFPDYYDSHFDIEGEEFDRRAGAGMKRRDMFSFLERAGYQVPLNGTVEFLSHHLSAADRIVVYLDEQKHQGEGKLLLSVKAALSYYPGYYGVEFINSVIDGKVETWRYLQMGIYGVWMKYRSDDDWRSNCGNVHIEILDHYTSGKPIPVPRPLYAVDLVGTDFKYAVDYNTAPGLRGTGLEDMFRPREVVDSIKAQIVRVTEQKGGWKGYVSI